MSIEIAKRRFFTLADGRIDFRACLQTAKEFRTARERRRPFGTPNSLNDLRDYVARVAGLVNVENGRWAAMTPALRAAATAFDSRFPDAQGDELRAQAIIALAAERPAFWSTAMYGDAIADALNVDPAGQMYPDSATTVFEALIARAVADARRLSLLIALNPAGEALLRNVRAALAMRGAALAA